jgi:hypothetical protein
MNMKKIVLLGMIFTAVAFLNPSSAQEKSKWKEMETFHGVMSTTFHPAEEGKFEPIRTRSGEMLEKAIAWKNSTAPEGYNQEAVQKILVQLVKGARKVDNLVKKSASDTDLKEQLTELHGVFHEIAEKCQH